MDLHADNVLELLQWPAMLVTVLAAWLVASSDEGQGSTQVTTA